VSARRLPDGSWAVFRGAAAEPVFVLQAPRAVQAPGGRAAAPGRAPRAAMTVRGHGSWLDVRLSIDRGWLTAPGRQFPVLLDPTITIQPDARDAHRVTNCTTAVSRSMIYGGRPVVAFIAWGHGGGVSHVEYDEAPV
jgi:hypothetical protein